MALDTASKRASAAHVKRLGSGVTPGAVGFAQRAAIAWDYNGNGLTPPPAGSRVAPDDYRLGECPVSVPTLGNMWG